MLVGGCDDTDCDIEDETEAFTVSGVLEEEIKKGNALLSDDVHNGRRSVTLED